MLKPLLQRSKAYYLFRKQDFVRALKIATTLKPQPEWISYAYFRAGMPLSVLAQPYPKQRLGQVAYTLSLAMVGRLSEAEQYAKQLVQKRLSRKQSLLLARGLAPFFPQLALALLEKSKHPFALYIALLLKTGQNQRAQTLLAAHLQKSRKPAELALFWANAAPLSAQEKTDWLNVFLQGYKLTPVNLKTAQQPLNVMNLVAQTSAREQAIPSAMPLVSVIVTTYQNADRIVTTLHSLLAQTYRNLEIIVVDDASKDHTEQQIKALMAEDKRIRYIKLSENKGTFFAKNIGLTYAQGEFITGHDSDDWAHPERIARQIQPLLNHADLIATVSYWIRIDDNGQFYARNISPLLRLNPTSLMFRANCNISWDNVRTGADSELLERLKYQFGKQAIKHIKLPLTLGAHHENSLMNAAETGYNQQGISLQRMEYMQSSGQKLLEQDPPNG